MFDDRSRQNKSSSDETSSLVKRLSFLREDLFGNDRGPSFFAQSCVPSFIVHLRSGGFVDVNDPFISRFSYPREQLLDGSVRAGQLIGRGERNLLQLARRFPDHIPEDPFVLECADQDGQTFPGKVSVSASDVQEDVLLFGSLEDVSDRADTERDLQDQLNVAIQSNKQMRTLMDKIRNITGVTSDLLTVRHEIGVLTKARSILCERMGMNFGDVAFYMMNESSSAVEQPFRDDSSESIPLSESHPAVKVVTGEEEFVRVGPNRLCLPLQGSDDRFGAMTIRLRPEERSLMEDDPSVWKGFKEILSILSNLIGLIIHNCRLAKQERQASIHDALTGVYNRRYFNKTLKQEVARAKRYGYPLSLMIIDADNFKEVNDSYGHQEGDRIIQQIAQTLERSSRQSDILCRFGGDEFALLLPSTEGEEADQLAYRIVKQFEQSTFTVNKEDGQVKEIPLRVSIGIGTCTGETDTSEDVAHDINGTDLLRVADRCMFVAKESEQGQIHQEHLSDHSDEMH